MVRVGKGKKQKIIGQTLGWMCYKKVFYFYMGREKAFHAPPYKDWDYKIVGLKLTPEKYIRTKKHTVYYKVSGRAIGYYRVKKKVYYKNKPNIGKYHYVTVEKKTKLYFKLYVCVRCRLRHGHVAHRLSKKLRITARAGCGHLCSFVF